MKPRRQVLQVSTFPFLAVLLCAMGSLILLLLVMDRRAKAVARAKAIRAASRLEAEEAEAAARRQAELEQRRRALHEQLDRQDHDLRAQVDAAMSQAKTTDESRRAEEERSAQARSQVQMLTSQLTREEEEVKARRGDRSVTSAKAQASEQEVTRLTSELVQLEKTLADFKAARAREPPRYSLVPYRGRRGDNRRPIYLECDGTGLVFHPDRQTLAGGDLSPDHIRAEVTARIARRPSESGTPYLLMLVRPAGIETYYRTVAALDGLKIDFGYEFIEPDWVLDFSRDEKGTSQPRVSPPREGELRMPVAARPAAPDSVAALQQSPAVPLSPGSGGRAAGASGSAYSAGFGSAGPGAAATAESPSAPVSPGALGKGAANPTGFGGGRVAPDQLSAGGSRVPGPVPTGGPTTTDLGRPGANLGKPVGQPEADAVQTPFAAGGSGTRMDVALGSGKPAPADIPTPASKLPAAVQNSAVPVPPVPESTGASNTRRGGGFAVEGSKAVGPTVSAGRAAATGATGGGPNGSSPHAAPGEPAKGADEDTGDRKPTGPAKPLFPDLAGQPDRPRPPPPSRRYGNRDFLILVECSGNSLLVTPGGLHIPADTLIQGPDVGRRLRESIAGLISRRQAMVRPGEPPYRPVIRFQVHPDGLQAYYLAYPALEPLGVVMTRENLRKEETKK